MLIQRFPNDPFRTMDLLLGAMMPNARRVPRPSASKLELSEHEDRFELYAELPGLAPEQLELSLGEGWIELSAKRGAELPEGYSAVRRERRGFELSRRIELPKRIDADSVEAVLRDGILQVTLPKHATLSPRTIAIKAA